MFSKTISKEMRGLVEEQGEPLSDGGATPTSTLQFLISLYTL